MKCHVYLNTFKRHDLFFKKWVRKFSLFSIKPIKSLSHFLFVMRNKVEFASISSKNKSYHCKLFKESIPLKSILLTYKYSVSLIITYKFAQPMFKYRLLCYPVIAIWPIFQYCTDIWTNVSTKILQSCMLWKEEKYFKIDYVNFSVTAERISNINNVLRYLTSGKVFMDVWLVQFIILFIIKNNYYVSGKELLSFRFATATRFLVNFPLLSS